jgi:hypothetical protein
VSLSGSSAGKCRIMCSPLGVHTDHALDRDSEAAAKKGIYSKNALNSVLKIIDRAQVRLVHLTVNGEGSQAVPKLQSRSDRHANAAHVKNRQSASGSRQPVGIKQNSAGGQGRYICVDLW